MVATYMQSETQAAAPAVSAGKLWAGRILTAIPVMFLTFDAVIKLLQLDVVKESLVQLGYPVTFGLTLGLLELFCLVLYVVPRTSVLGAILMTGYLGGAVATHVRLEQPLFSHTLFPIYIALMLWGGLYLREARLRAIVPLRD